MNKIYLFLALLIASAPAFTQGNIWSDASSVSPLVDTYRIPIATSSSSGPSYIVPGAMKAFIEAGGTVTASDPILDLSQTWNNGAVTFTGVNVNVTNTASASTSKVAAFQVGGVNKVVVAATGSLHGYDTYTDELNYGRLALNTNLTGDWVQVAAETAGTAGDNYGIALTPAGLGAISAQVPDSTDVGGNTRGLRAVDFQLIRGANSQVASGASAFIGNGSSNTASGSYSVVVGGLGNVSGGAGSWIPGGNYATARGLEGAGAYASGRRSAVGDAQVILQPVRRTTTDATPVSLATDGTPAATTVMVLPASSMMACEALVGMKYGSDSAGYKLLAVFERDGSNNTSLVGSVPPTVIAEDAGLSGANATFVANDTLESAQVEVTGPAGTAYSVAEVKCVQVL